MRALAKLISPLITPAEPAPTFILDAEKPYPVKSLIPQRRPTSLNHLILLRRFYLDLDFLEDPDLAGFDFDCS